jgi:spore coat protein U-like protein
MSNIERLPAMRAIVVALVLPGIAMPSPGSAQSEQNQAMLVTATVPQSCTVAPTGDLSFWATTTGRGLPEADAVATVDVTCTTGTSWSIYANAGLHADATSGAGQRRVASSDGTIFVAYDLYSDAAHDDAFPTDAATGQTSATQGTGTDGAQPVMVYGRVPAATSSPVAGVYSDTVTFTVTF